jgi:hypothetical protein
MIGGGGLKGVDLKRNPSNDESDLFKSAHSEINREFLQVRDLKKPIMEFAIDQKREHFCVNLIFKFNKKNKYKSASQSSGMGKSGMTGNNTNSNSNNNNIPGGNNAH